MSRMLKGKLFNLAVMGVLLLLIAIIAALK